MATSRNLGAGTKWDFSLIPGRGVLTSPKRLGDQDVNGVFAAIKFESTDDFRTVYKFDWSKNTGTPEGGGLAGITDATVAGVSGAYDIPASQLQVFYTERPDALNAAYHTHLFMKSYGHKLTSTYNVADNVTLKNIAAYRYAYSWGNYQLDGLGGLRIGPNNVVGQPAGTPFIILGTSTYTQTEQWSDELQLNADTELANVTAGLIYFHSSAWKGSAAGTRMGNYASGPIPGFNLSNMTPGVGTTTYTKQTSLAAYFQAEFHIIDQLDLMAGARVTQDKKGTVVPVEGLTIGGNLAYTDFKYIELSPIGAAQGIVAGTRPKWAGSVKARYETQPQFNDTSLVVSADTNYHSGYCYLQNGAYRPIFPNAKIPSAWVANARAGLVNIEVAGHSLDAAPWVKNLFDNKDPVYGAFAGSFVFNHYESARTDGIDLTFNW